MKSLEKLQIYILYVSIFTLCLVGDSSVFPRVENLFILFIILYLVSRKIKIDFFAKLLFCLFIFSLLSAIINISNIGDITFTYRFIKLLVFYLMVYNLPYETKKVENVIRAVFLILFFINLAILLDIPSVSSFLSKIYQKESQIIDLPGSRTRLYGTMGNPNENSVLLLVFLAYFISLYYYQKKNWQFIFIGISIVMLIFTESRTAFVGMVGMFAALLFKKHTKRGIVVIAITIFLALSGIIAVVQNVELKNLNQLFTQNPAEINSLVVRYEIWGNLIDLWREKPVLGWGPYLNYFKINNIDPDSEYILFLFSYGIVGALLLLLIYVVPIFSLWQKKKTVGLSLIGVILPIGLAACSLTNVAILNVRTGLLYIIFIAIASSARNRTDSQIYRNEN